jgi:hypothetical protein
LCTLADQYILETDSYIKFGEPPKRLSVHHHGPNLDTWKDNIICNLQIPHPNILKLAVEDKGAIYIVSDGGVHHYHGNFAATIASTTLPLTHTHGKIYSIEWYEFSYRLELYGMLAGVVMLQYIIKEESLQHPEEKKIELYCDNSLVVNKSENACNSAGLSIKTATQTLTSKYNWFTNSKYSKTRRLSYQFTMFEAIKMKTPK